MDRDWFEEYQRIVTVNKIFRLKRILGRKKEQTGSCGMIDNPFLKSVSPTFDISTPSMLIEPDSSSTSRYIAVMRLLLPAPVLEGNHNQPHFTVEERDFTYRPIIPIFSPALTSKDMPVR